MPVAKITGFADVPFQSSGEEIEFAGPFVPAISVPSDDNTQTVGTPLGDGMATALSGLLGNTQLKVVVLGGLPLSLGQKNSALAGVANLLTPVLNVIDGPLTQLFEALGLHLGGADITILSVYTPGADDPPVEQPSLAR